MKVRWPAVAGIAVAAALALQFPPAGSWPRFWALDVSDLAKMRLLALIYLLPFVLSFTAMVCFQLQMRVAMAGAPASQMFLMAMVAWGLFTELIFGAGRVESRPGYVMGMALAVTMMGRLYAVRRRLWHGIPLPRVIWRGDAEGVAQVQAEVQAGLARRRAPEAAAAAERGAA